MILKRKFTTFTLRISILTALICLLVWATKTPQTPATDKNPVVLEATVSPTQPEKVPEKVPEKPPVLKVEPAGSLISNTPITPPTSTDDFQITQADRDLMKEMTDSDFVKLGKQMRLFKKVHDYIYFNQKSSRVNAYVKEAIEFLDEIDKKLFSWLSPMATSTIDLRQSFVDRGSGIVICVGNHHTKIATATLKMIREIFKLDIPVEVFYIGEGDLSLDNRKLFEEIPNVKTINIETLLDNSKLQLGGWAVKTFAMLASSFKEVMLIDADVVFLQSPQTLFDNALYKKYGAYFFHDRTLFSSAKETQDWFFSFMPTPPSSYSQSLRIFNGKTGHEQESGVVLINKEKSLPGLLTSCTLNVDKIRKVAYKQVFGDKETFWLGFEAVQQSYIFNPSLPGSAGKSVEKSDGQRQICARQLMHADDKGVPVWINGGIAVSKYESDSPLAPLEEYILEPGHWELKESNMACLSNSRPIPKFSPQIDVAIKMSGAILLRERLPK